MGVSTFASFSFLSLDFLLHFDILLKKDLFSADSNFLLQNTGVNKKEAGYAPYSLLFWGTSSSSGFVAKMWWLRCQELWSLTSWNCASSAMEWNSFYSAFSTEVLEEQCSMSHNMSTSHDTAGRSERRAAASRPGTAAWTYHACWGSGREEQQHRGGCPSGWGVSTEGGVTGTETGPSPTNCQSCPCCWHSCLGSVQLKIKTLWGHAAVL